MRDPLVPALPDVSPELVPVVLNSIHEMRATLRLGEIPPEKRASAFMTFMAFTEDDPDGQMVRVFTAGLGSRPLPPPLAAGVLYPRELLFQSTIIMLLVSVFGVPLEVAAKEVPSLYKTAMRIETLARERYGKGGDESHG